MDNGFHTERIQRARPQSPVLQFFTLDSANSPISLGLESFLALQGSWVDYVPWQFRDLKFLMFYYNNNH